MACSAMIAQQVDMRSIRRKSLQEAHTSFAVELCVLQSRRPLVFSALLEVCLHCATIVSWGTKKRRKLHDSLARWPTLTTLTPQRAIFVCFN